MQVLISASILIYSIYFTCVIYETVRFSKVCTAGASAINVSKNRVAALNIDLVNKSHERNDYSDIYLRSCHSSIRYEFATKKFTEMKTENLMAQRYNFKNRRNLFFCADDRTHWRKLLGCERNFPEHSTKRHRSSRLHRAAIAARGLELQKGKRGGIAKPKSNYDDEDIDPTAWDIWSEWSECSVTCGQGRQVRWRHCLSKDCVTGLKKAQLKSCRRKKCSKSLLTWLGIRS